MTPEAKASWFCNASMLKNFLSDLLSSRAFPRCHPEPFLLHVILMGALIGRVTAKTDFVFHLTTETLRVFAYHCPVMELRSLSGQRQRIPRKEALHDWKGILRRFTPRNDRKKLLNMTAVLLFAYFPAPIRLPLVRQAEFHRGEGAGRRPKWVFRVEREPQAASRFRGVDRCPIRVKTPNETDEG